MTRGTSAGDNVNASANAIALRLARWFDERLSDTDVQPTSMARLYGLEVLDLEPLHVRTVFVAEARSMAAVLEHPSVTEGFSFDAAAIVEFPWLRAETMAARPGEYGRRERGRLVRVCTYEGGAATLCRVGELEVCSEQRS